MDEPRRASTPEVSTFLAATDQPRGLIRAALAAAFGASLVTLIRLEQHRRRAASAADGRGGTPWHLRLAGRPVEAGGAARRSRAASTPPQSDPRNPATPSHSAESGVIPVGALVSALTSQAEETGRLRERLAAAEQRAAAAEAAAREAERRRQAEAAVADRFVGLLEERLRVAEREAARLAVERNALGAEFARLWAARGDRTGPGSDAR